MFAAGQLGVAIGRVKSPGGLQLLNFKKEVCLPQPTKISEFLQTPSKPVADDLTCCHMQRLVIHLLHLMTNIQVFQCLCCKHFCRATCMLSMSPVTFSS